MAKSLASPLSLINLLKMSNDHKNTLWTVSHRYTPLCIFFFCAFLSEFLILVLAMLLEREKKKKQNRCNFHPPENYSLDGEFGAVTSELGGTGAQCGLTLEKPHHDPAAVRKICLPKLAS